MDQEAIFYSFQIVLFFGKLVVGGDSVHAVTQTSVVAKADRPDNTSSDSQMEAFYNGLAQRIPLPLQPINSCNNTSSLQTCSLGHPYVASVEGETLSGELHDATSTPSSSDNPSRSALIEVQVVKDPILPAKERPLRALVDTGASISIVRRNALPTRILQRATSSSRELKTFDPSFPTISTSEQVQIPLVCQGLEFTISAVIVDNLSVDLIIGLDEITKNDILIGGKNGRLIMTIRGLEIDTEDTTYLVQVVASANIGARKFRRFEVRLVHASRHVNYKTIRQRLSNETANQRVLIQLDDSMKLDDFPTLHTTDDDGKTFTFISNEKENNKKRLYVGMAVGKAHILPPSTTLAETPMHQFIGMAIQLQHEALIKEGMEMATRPEDENIMQVTSEPTFPSPSSSTSSIKSEMIEHLTDEQKATVLKLYNDFSKVLVDVLPAGGLANVPPHTIVLDSLKAISQQPRHMNPFKAAIADQEIDAMLKAGFIAEHEGPWAAPIQLVRKKDGTWRFCIDYRNLNSHTISDKYPLPRISQIIDSLHGARWFTTLDLASGYWQIKLDAKSQNIASFVTHRGQYRPLVMPFGLKNAPAAFQRALNTILKDYIGKWCYVYIDDILIYSQNFEEHCQHVQIILKALAQANLFVKSKKCKWFQNEVEYLGHKLTANGASPQDSKVAIRRNARAPTNLHELRSFLGLANYYRRFIKDFAMIVQPMNLLLRKDTPFHWTEAQQASFELVKYHLTSPLLLYYPVFDKENPFILETDASNIGMGAILSQKFDDLEHPVSYWSSQYDTPKQSGYSATDREFLAIMKAVRHYDYLLDGSKFTIRTDHQPLVDILHLKELGNDMRSRWLNKLQRYDYKTIYVPGKHNAADALSRPPLVDSRNNSDTPSASTNNRISFLISSPSSIVDIDTSERHSQSKNSGDSAIFAGLDENLMARHSAESVFGHSKPGHTVLPNTPAGLTSPITSASSRNFTHLQHDVSLRSSNSVDESGDSVPPRVEREPQGIHNLGRIGVASQLSQHAPQGPTSMIVDHPMETVSHTGAEAISTATGVHPKHQAVRLFVEGESKTISEWQSKDEFIKKLLEVSHLDKVQDAVPSSTSSSTSDQSLTTQNVARLPKSLKKLQRHVVYLSYKNQILYYKNRIILPQQLRDLILFEFHDSTHHGSHLGRLATYQKIFQRFWWPSMRKDINNYVDSCVNCQKSKARHSRPYGLLHPLPDVSRFFQLVGMDFSGPLTKTLNDNRYLLVLIDYYSHWVEAFALPDQTAESVIKVFADEIIPRWGCPEQIVTDQGSNFLSGIMHQLYAFMRTTKLTTTAYHPQTNGLTERVNGVIKKILTQLVENVPQTWDQHLPAVLHSIRTTPSPALGGYSPFNLVTGQMPRHPLDILIQDAERNSDITGDGYTNALHLRLNPLQRNANMLVSNETRRQMKEIKMKQKKEDQEKMKRLADEKRREHPFKPGMLVFKLIPTGNLGTPSLSQRYKGPFKILAEHRDTHLNFKIQGIDGGKVKTVHVDKLVPAHVEPHSEPSAQIEIPLPPGTKKPIDKLNLEAKHMFEEDVETHTIDENILQLRAKHNPTMQSFYTRLLKLLRMLEEPNFAKEHPILLAGSYFDDIMTHFKDNLHAQDYVYMYHRWRLATMYKKSTKDVQKYIAVLRHWITGMRIKVIPNPSSSSTSTASSSS